MTSGRNTGGDSGEDLPDIVDVVMEMGRGAPEQPAGEAQVPSPPLPVAPSSWLPVHLDALAGRARDLCRSGEFRQHPARLCVGLEAFRQLVSPLGF